MFKVISVVVLLSVALTGCILPEGSYTIPQGWHANVYNELDTPVYQFCSGYCPGDPTATPEIIIETPAPTTPPLKVCELMVQGSPQNVRSDHRLSAPILGNLGIGSRPTGLEFYYPLDLTEWARVDGINYLTGLPIEGWILVNANVLYDPQGPCLDVPATYEVAPLPTATPAPTNTPVITPTPDGCWLTAPTTSYVNVRTLPALTAPIVARFENGATTAGLARTVNSGYTWYKVWWFGQYAWIAGTNTISLTGECASLPTENPF